MVGEKTVAPSLHNSKFQELKTGDLAILFFRESCPYCKDFKPTWNRVAKGLQNRWPTGSAAANASSIVYDGDVEEGGDVDPSKLVGPPKVAKIDVTKFPAVKNTIRFPTVPCIAFYKTDQPVVFFTSSDRSLPNVLQAIENYYKRAQLPPRGEYVIGTETGTWPEDRSATPQTKSIESKPSRDKLKPSFVVQKPQTTTATAPARSAIASASVMSTSSKSARGAMTYNKPPPQPSAKPQPSTATRPSAMMTKPTVSITPAANVSNGARPPSVHRTSNRALAPITLAPAATGVVHAVPNTTQPIEDPEVFARFLALLTTRKGQLE